MTKHHPNCPGCFSTYCDYAPVPTDKWDANRKANNARIDAIFAELRRKRDPMYAQPAELARAA